ncbi:MAG: gluconate 2-dehydrogenase subunit 3 family protein [Deltaproteobacteria bacterium]|nr:gluconate 2-dehydrogenase subunit 3 family protein [Deltaproteobacteria bacterium]
MAQRILPHSSARFSRRTALRACGAVGGIALVGAVGYTAHGHAHRYEDVEPACPLRAFTRREFQIVADLADVMFPEGNALGITGREARVPEYVDHMVAGLERDKATEMKAMFLLFEHGTLAFGLRTRRFTDLPPREKEKYLRRWERSRVYSRRMLAAGVKTLLGLAYFAHPAVRERMGVHRACGSAGDALPREEWS